MNIKNNWSAMARWPEALDAADAASEPFGDVAQAVRITEQNGALVVVLGVRLWKMLSCPLRTAQAIAAIEKSVAEWRGRVELAIL